MSDNPDFEAEERYAAAALAASNRLQHFNLPVEIVRSENGVATYIKKAS